MKRNIPEQFHRCVKTKFGAATTVETKAGAKMSTNLAESLQGALAGVKSPVDMMRNLAGISADCMKELHVLWHPSVRSVVHN